MDNTDQYVCMYMYVCMYGRVADWLERQRSDHATKPSAWHLWKVPENHTTCQRPNPCEGTWVDETV